MNRLKTMPRSDFEVVLAENWRPVILEGDAMPEFTRRIPREIRCCIIASGQYQASVPYPCSQLPDAHLVGGIDAWRYADDDPQPYNKDWYAILASPSTPELLYAAGPQKDSEHWSPDIPERYQGIKIIKL